MANVKISALPVSAGLDGTEIVPVVDGGVTQRTTTEDIAGVVIATPFTITTMPNTVSGIGNMSVLIFPDYTTALAFAIDGDAFPRIIIGSDGNAGLMLGDGTFDPSVSGPYMYTADGGDLIAKARSGHSIDFQATTVTVNGQVFPDFSNYVVSGAVNITSTGDFISLSGVGINLTGSSAGSQININSTGAGGIVQITADSNTVIKALTGSISIYAGGTPNIEAGVGIDTFPTLGFYGTAPVSKPPVPVTLGDVIAALQSLGLVGT